MNDPYAAVLYSYTYYLSANHAASPAPLPPVPVPVPVPVQVDPLIKTLIATGRASGPFRFAVSSGAHEEQ